MEGNAGIFRLTGATIAVRIFVERTFLPVYKGDNEPEIQQTAHDRSLISRGEFRQDCYT